MSRPKALPDDVRNICIQLIRGYERRAREYYSLRREIINESRCRRVEVKDPENPEKTIWVYPPNQHCAGRNTEEIALRLAAIDRRMDTKIIHAIDDARLRIGADLPEALRIKLSDAIWRNCCNGRRYRYEFLDVLGIGRTNFYERRTQFLIDIAYGVGLLGD